MQKTIIICIALMLSLSVMNCSVCTDVDKAVIKSQNAKCKGDLQCLAEKLQSVASSCIKEVMELGTIESSNFANLLSVNVFNPQAEHNFERFEGDLAFVGHSDEVKPSVQLTVAEIILSIVIILCVIGFTIWAFWPQGQPIQQPIKQLHH